MTGLFVLALLASIVAARDITVGGFSWSDAPLHAMDGVFLHDLLRARPSGSWHQWAEQYYARHQCLGIIVYYPPLFATVEAIVFLLLGISVATARLAVVLFVIATVWLIFLLGRELFGAAAGFVGAVLALTCPAGVTWSRQVMLEWPAVFWIALALLAGVRYFRKPNWRWGILAAAGCLGAYLTKQTAGFVVAIIPLYGVVAGQRKAMRRGAFWLPLAFAVAAMAAYGLATAGLNALAGQLIAGRPPWRHLASTSHWSWYLLRLAPVLGWPVILACGVAAVAFLRSTDFRHRAGIPALWAGGWWLVATAIDAKEERYFFFAVPALALLAGAGLVEMSRRLAPKPALSVLVLFSAFCLVRAAGRSPDRIANTKQTVEFLRQTDADLVLVDAVRDGQFIFDVRTSGPRGDPGGGRLIPMRASKFLYSRAARSRYDYQQHVQSPEDILGWLHLFGVRYIVMEDRLPTTGRVDEDRSWDPPPRLMLRELVQDADRFERVFSEPMKCQDPGWDAVHLVTYRYRKSVRRTEGTVRIPIPAMGKSIVVELPSTRPE